MVDLDYFIESASSAKYGIILVDACRNNPLIKYFQNGKHKGSTAKKGLGQVTPTTGQVVIGFATSAGDTADDGKGNMSPYARALSERLKERDDIRNVLGKVAEYVSGKYDQSPIYRANLAYEVCLNNCKNRERSQIEFELVTKVEKVKSNLDPLHMLLQHFNATLKIMEYKESKSIRDKISQICSEVTNMETKILLLNELRKDKAYQYELIKIEMIKAEYCRR